MALTNHNYSMLKCIYKPPQNTLVLIDYFLEVLFYQAPNNTLVYYKNGLKKEERNNQEKQTNGNDIIVKGILAFNVI